MEPPNCLFTRRHALLGLAGLPALAKGGRIDHSRVSAITDEIARTPAGAIEFARQYGLQWLELRSVPGVRKEYFQLEEAEIKQAALEFRDAGLRISFLNTSMLKYALPGYEPANPRTKDNGRHDRRMEEMKKAVTAAHILGVDKVRVFTYMRLVEPDKAMQKVAGVLNELAEVASRERIHLLIENEGACNVGTAAELAALLKMVPSKWVGVNWDPFNAANRKEIAFPDGYELLGAKRIRNVQIKGKSILPEYPDRLDWAAIFRRLEKDGYSGQVGLETHIFGEILVQKSHESIREILKLVGKAS